ncbi:MAG: hypothetical protein AAFX58_08640 [Pseudomonadota bacterium]
MDSSLGSGRDNTVRLTRRDAFVAGAGAAVSALWPIHAVAADGSATATPRVATAPGHVDGGVYQFAYVVENLDTAAAYWLARSAGPFFALRDVAFPVVHVPHAAPSPVISILLGYSGDTLLELIEVEHDPQGLFATPGLPGPHHVARLTPDIDGAIAAEAALGRRCVFHAGMELDAAVAFIDTRQDIGVLTELVSHTDTVADMLAVMYGAALEFDGTDPVRTF